MKDKIKNLDFKDLPFKPSDNVIFYIEGRYSVAINRVLMRHWRELDSYFYVEWDSHFCYLPLAHQLLSNEQLRWYVPSLPVKKARKLLQQAQMSLLDYQCGAHLKHSLPPGLGIFSFYSYRHSATMDFVELGDVNERNYLEVFADAAHRLLDDDPNDNLDVACDNLDEECDDSDVLETGVMFSIARELYPEDTVNSIARPISADDEELADDYADWFFNKEVRKSD